jgi:hypothetical protein
MHKYSNPQNNYQIRDQGYCDESEVGALGCALSGIDATI